ncbi:MAG TPA: MotA/TolQ/ExbB proton channel family protein, partial [Armatimonadota bacterium]|nr:MotA/TolQ/ExbB proton channel family protein [Armatimonadota bacterium]
MTSKKAPVNMDLATVIGLLLAWGALLIALFMEGGSISDLINPSALIIVVGGTIGATTVAFSMKQILGLPAIIRNAFFSKETDLSQVIYRMVVLARKARQDGILALEEESRRVNNKFLKMGIRLVVDGVPSEMVREILETETISLQERHKVGENIFATMGGFAPTMGIIGTVMGLMRVAPV